MKADTVVIGGGVAGGAAAIAARTLHPDKNVLMVRKETRAIVPCGIPYTIATMDSAERDAKSDDGMKKRGIGVRVAAVEEIDTEKRLLRLSDGQTLEYGRLVICTGSGPVLPPIDGVDADGVWTVKKELEHMSAMRAAIHDARRIVVIGGGFIGVEFADEMSRLQDKEVHVVEMLPHCLALAFDEEFCEEAEERLRRAGVHVHTGARVEKIVADGRVRGVQVSGAGVLDADLVLVAVGARARVEPARQAGIAVESGAVSVDAFMRTSVDGVLAAGDCAAKRELFTGTPSRVMLASVAAREGRIAAAALFSRRPRLANRGTIPTFNTSISGLVMGAVGLTESLADRLGVRTVGVVQEGVSRHPKSLPGATPQRLKLLFSEDGLLLGAQASGGASVAEMTNVLGTLTLRGTTASEILTSQIATHPLLTGSPNFHVLAAAAVRASSML